MRTLLDYPILENDDMLIAKAMQKPLFGWGGWSRNRVFEESGRDMAVTDGFWILELGSNGCVGLISMTLAMLLPVAAGPGTPLPHRTMESTQSRTSGGIRHDPGHLL